MFEVAQEAVWITDSTPPTMYFVRAGGVKTEDCNEVTSQVSSEGLNRRTQADHSLAQDTLQVTLQLSEPGTVWCPKPSLHQASS